MRDSPLTYTREAGGTRETFWDINIPKGTEITAYVAGNIPLDKAKFQASDQPQAGGSPAGVSSAGSASSQTVLSVSSTPAAADVEVDGNFVGNTPSSVTLTAGEHAIRITKKGYKPWERKITVSGGAANVSAELDENK